jgi:peptide chain release factor 1
MFQKLDEIEKRYVDLEARSQSPEVVSDHVEYTKTARAMKDIAPIVEKVRERRRIEKELEGAKELFDTLPPADELRPWPSRSSRRCAPGRTPSTICASSPPEDPNDSRTSCSRSGPGRRR